MHSNYVIRRTEVLTIPRFHIVDRRSDCEEVGGHQRKSKTECLFPEGIFDEGRV